MLLFPLLACSTPPASPEAAPPEVKPVDVVPVEPEPDPQFCRVVPNAGAPVCWHALGGLFGEGACAGADQCCAGAFHPAGTCGECLCDESTGQEGCVASGAEVCFPLHRASVEPLPDALRESMRGVTWTEGCPVPLEELALVTTSHWGFDGEARDGRLVVRADLAPVYVEVFRHAWNVQFPIERMVPASEYGGSDEASMAANNTSAFNCRAVTGGTSYSQHSFGHAIDINPRQNPYVSASGKTVLPPESKPFVSRDPSVPGSITDPGPIVGAFRRHGWGWGGNWTRLKDYQHFSENGR